MNNLSLYYHTKSDSPCFNCKDRATGCHSNCKAYSEYKAVNAEDREKRIEGRKSSVAEYELIKHSRIRKAKHVREYRK